MIFNNSFFQAAENLTTSLARLFTGDNNEETNKSPIDTKPGQGNLLKIFWRAKPHEAVDATPEKNFILKHEKWVDPEFILQVGKREKGKIVNV